jgi:hypothetical protein
LEPPVSAGAFIFAKRNLGADHLTYRRKQMNKDLAITNILSLHQELMKATEINELYCKQNNLRMSELWLEQINLIVEEIKLLGDNK